MGRNSYANQFRLPDKHAPEGVVRCATGYKPRKHQEMLHRKLKRFNVLVCHRRFGKTVFSINEMIDQALRNKRHNPQYAYIAPTYKQAKMIAWEYLIDFTKNIPGMEANKSELTISIHRQGIKNKDGSWIKEPDKIKFILLGAENPDSIRGIYLDGVILDEYAQCDPSIWGEVVFPTLADRKGWAIFIGTPKGQNHFYKKYQEATENPNDPNWYSVLLRASETKIVDLDELQIMRKGMSQEQYDQELECSFTAALIGAYYGHIINRMYDDSPQRITRLVYNPAFPVDTFWDIGVSDDTAIWFRQKIGPNYYYIDYYVNKGEGIGHYIEVLKNKRYRYGRHVMPHDIKVKEFGSGMTRIETALKMGLVVEVQKKQAVMDRIDASRMRLSTCYIDPVKCEKGLDALKGYEREFDSKNDMFKKTPKHNWASNGSDAFGYSALDERDSDFMGTVRKNLPKTANSSYNEFSG